eukprot:52740_1
MRVIVDPFAKNSFFHFDDYLLNTYGIDAYKQLNGQTYWERVSTDHKVAQDLQGVLKELAPEPEIIPNISDYVENINDIDDCKIVDIGGGIGELLYDICIKNPNTQGILYETKTRLEDAYKYYFANKQLLNNIQFVEGDLFDEDHMIKMCKDCNVFIVKRVLHDWD